MARPRAQSRSAIRGAAACGSAILAFAAIAAACTDADPGDVLVLTGLNATPALPLSVAVYALVMGMGRAIGIALAVIGAVAVGVGLWLAFGPLYRAVAGKPLTGVLLAPLYNAVVALLLMGGGAVGVYAWGRIFEPVWWRERFGRGCPECGYDLAGLARGAKCPECGRAEGERAAT